MPWMLLIASSKRSVISVSTTRAFAPGKTVVTLTTGGSMAGSSRTGSRDRPISPKRISARFIIVARTGRWMEARERNMEGKMG